MQVGSSSHILLDTESVKNWCHYGNIVDSASHSEHLINIELRILNICPCKHR
jgi:hypothetical protein